MKNPRTLDELVSLINLRLQSFALSSWEDLRLILRTNYPHFDRNIEATGYSIVHEKKVPENLAHLKTFIKQLNDTLGLGINLAVWRLRCFYIIRFFGLLPVLLFLFVSYMVLGGIATGQSSLLRNSDPFLAFAVLLFLILLLGSLEGLQISITILRLKELDHFSSEYPRAYKLHKKFKSEERVKQFLAGRQLLVIIVVFFAAQLTSFPHMKTFPGTSVEFPPGTDWLQVILLRLGILGALFVLWIGQLIPQFLANKHPIWFLNLPPMGPILELSLIFDSLGFTRPGDWPTKLLKGGEYILPSSRERYSQELQGNGYGILALKKEWDIDVNCAKLCYNSTIVFVKPGFQKVTDWNLELLGGVPRKIYSDAQLLQNEWKENIEADPNRSALIQQSTATEERFANGSTRKHIVHEVVATRGSFKPNDVLQVTTEIECDYASADRIRIPRPTQLIIFRLKVKGNPSIIRGRVKMYKEDEVLGENAILLLDNELPQQRHGETTILEYSSLYPETHVYYDFEWEVEYGRVG